MTIEFEIRGMADDDKLRRRVASDLAELAEALALTSARVALQCQREARPPYQALATLTVPGPDLQAAARDHTWPAAWEKVVTRLREQVTKRRSQQFPGHERQPRNHRPASHPPKAKAA